MAACWPRRAVGLTAPRPHQVLVERWPGPVGGVGGCVASGAAAGVDARKHSAECGTLPPAHRGVALPARRGGR